MNYIKEKNHGLYDSQFEHDSCGIGFVANIKGRKSYDIVKRGLEVLERMTHRGAEGADNKTGDGAGIMIQIPHNFYSEEIASLPPLGDYGTGLVFLSKDKHQADTILEIIREVLKEEGLELFAQREVITDSSVLGDIAKSAEPAIKQIFVKKLKDSNKALELRLYIARKIIEKKVRDLKSDLMFYMPSLSTKTIVYKGMLMPGQVRQYFADLRDDRMESSIALVHSRFSTNTFPSWDLAQPFRILAHNGEINTIKGNRFWMQAREEILTSSAFGDDIKKILPVIEPGKSDSASFDNVVEFLVAAGMSLPQALMIMIPESWNDKNPIPDYLKYFYEYYAVMMEPWDGPASMVFCDGRFIGGTLDRNGLRPSRYVVTKDNLIVMASEVGVQNFKAEEILYKGRLMPGKLLLVDTLEGRIIPDEEVKKQIALARDYEKWIKEKRSLLEDFPDEDNSVEISEKALLKKQKCFGYTKEDVDTIINVMATTAQEPVGSMGNDAPLAVFSELPQNLFNYFKQVFAQVTNPPIDSIREELVMSNTSFLGKRVNLLEPVAEYCNVMKIFSPLLKNSELKKIISNNNPYLKAKVVDCLFNPEKKGAMEQRLQEIFDEVCDAIDSGFSIIVLSDKKAGDKFAAIPSLLVCSGLHHHLIKTSRRTKASIILETGEAREVMHFALLIGYGADAINPYLAYATIFKEYKEGKLSFNGDYNTLESNYIKAINKGLLKVYSKMGISTIRSYRGAQTFEALGLNSDFVDKYFTGTTTRISGADILDIEYDYVQMFKKSCEQREDLLESIGIYSYRKRGEKHAWNPESIYLLQWATRTGEYYRYKMFTKLVDEENRRPHFIRGLFDFDTSRSIPIDEVESIEGIMKRLTTGAMSFGSISKEAHEAIAIAMNSIQGRSNSGEGGEDPLRYLPRPDGTLARSAIKQVASGRFGVTSNYLANADEIQIKIAQGAKPGEGGQLPGHKVDEIIARTRYSTPGVTLISPPPHHDIYSIEDLAQLIFDLKNANPNARISVKLVSESGVGTIAAGVAKAHADNILISGYEGGTGASPISSIKHAGLPWEIGLAETHQTLVKNNLRGRVKLQTDGQLKTGRDVVIAAMLGAEEFGFGTAVLIVLGCVMMRKCHVNTCPVGIATQDPELRKRFSGKPDYIINYFKFMAQEIREIMASVGVKTFDEIVGRSDLLIPRKLSKSKVCKIDLTSLIASIPEAKVNATRCVTLQAHKIHHVLDRKIIERLNQALSSGSNVNIYVDMPISNTDRSVGAMLSYEISKRFGENGLPDNSVHCSFHGSAGQSFGAFLTKGVTFRLEGDANDYFGKGLSGGRLILVPPSGSSFKSEENIIVGNTVLYGATGGEVYVNGVAGERFCVRNSGAVAVVEGTGDHCAEYMTGGRLIVLGKVGRNFAAGMSGGIAYVLDVNGDFDYYCNKGMVELSPVRDFDDQDFIIETLKKHIHYTDSSIAKQIILKWYDYLPKFVKVLPLEYKRALNEFKNKLIDEKLKAIREEEQIQESF